MEVDVEYFIVVVGNSFGSSTARCQAKNDFKSLVQAQKQKGKVKKNKKNCSYATCPVSKLLVHKYFDNCKIKDLAGLEYKQGKYFLKVSDRE